MSKKNGLIIGGRGGGSSRGNYGNGGAGQGASLPYGSRCSGRSSECKGRSCPRGQDCGRPEASGPPDMDYDNLSIKEKMEW